MSNKASFICDYMLGETLRNRYNIIKLLGSGGFGDTYLAIDLDFPAQPKCVVKRLKPQNPNVFAVAKDLFKKEAEILSKLGDHPQIPSLKAFFSEKNQFFLVQEYIEGHDLTKELIPGKCFTEQETVKLLKEILEVLSFVHQRNKIHRDIKPENIMRRNSDKKIFLIDFGAVKEIGTLVYNSVTGQTTITMIIGTPGYMPDEQANGKPKLASDVYAVGIIAIQAITGLNPADIPYDEHTQELLWRNKVQKISSSLATIIDKMVAGYLPNRYKNATEVENSLNTLSFSFNTTVVIKSTSTNPPYGSLLTRNRFIQMLLYGSGGAISSWVIGSVLKEKKALISTPISTPIQETPIPKPRPTPEPIPKPESTQATITTNDNSLKSFDFEVITVDKAGKIDNVRTKNNKYLTVDLGNGVTMDLIAIPFGTFIMGSSENEKGRDLTESPQKDITVQAFLIGRYPVTQGQYQQIMQENPSYFKGRNLPVERVSWNNAVSFCNQVSQVTGKKITLPTEAQWEYAARGGTLTPFHFGETITSELANYYGIQSYANEPQGIYRIKTTPVGTFPPNSFGLCDIHGNVWEWCKDDWNQNYLGSPIDGSSFTNKKNNQVKILRGGAWDEKPENCRSANRERNYRWIVNNFNGFRVVCNLQ